MEVNNRICAAIVKDGTAVRLTGISLRLTVRSVLGLALFGLGVLFLFPIRSSLVRLGFLVLIGCCCIGYYAVCRRFLLYALAGGESDILASRHVRRWDGTRIYIPPPAGASN